jgi:hypothetical protein
MADGVGRICKVSTEDAAAMLNAENNDLLTRVGPGTPMGTLMRHY